MQGFQLKPNMKLGVATAATQIEGGDTNNSWYDWYLKGKIKDQTSPARANDHYVRYQEDIALLQELGIQVYRFGVEWSRIEPENGQFDEHAINHYKHELTLLRQAGIEPLVTLHHFTNPLWVEKMGAFENAAVTQYYLRFVEKVVRAFGDLASEYITINEPNVYAVNGFYMGDWPPGKKSFRASDYPIERYYHWCFLDNFEWIEGESARFGIVHVDYETQTRTIKESGRFYREIIRQQGVTPELYKQYANQTYPMR